MFYMVAFVIFGNMTSGMELIAFNSKFKWVRRSFRYTLLNNLFMISDQGSYQLTNIDT